MMFNDIRSKGLKNEYNTDALETISGMAMSNMFECSTCRDLTTSMQFGGYSTTTMQSEGDPSKTMQSEGDPSTTMQSEGDPSTTMQSEEHLTMSVQSGTENVEHAPSAKEDSVNDKAFLLLNQFDENDSSSV
jgi:hypothetical protein